MTLNKAMHLEFSRPPLATRTGYGDKILELGKRDSRIMVLCADLTESTQVHKFAAELPAQFVEMGIAEQNLVTVAAGLAHLGKIPFISSYAMFAPGRCWEQVRTVACYNDENVKVMGAHAGISVGPDGATHQAIEDLAIMRVLPNMVVIVPADYEQTKKATAAVAERHGPAYMRFAREKTPQMTTPETPFSIGRAQVWRDGSDVAIIGCGPLLMDCLQAAEKLEGMGVSARVINCHTLKPLDTKTILAAAKETKGIVSVEEHQVIGGLGGAIAELLAKEHPCPMRFIGIQDRYGESGPPDQLLKKFGCTAEDIVRAAQF